MALGWCVERQQNAQRGLLALETTTRWVRQDMARLESRLDNGRIDALGTQLGELRERMAHLEGLLEGLREAISGRVSAAS